MKLKYILLFLLISISFFCVDNVSAKTYDYSYSYGGSTYNFSYDSIKNEICVENVSECIQITKPYLYFYWQDSYLNVTQSDTGFILYQEEGIMPDGSTAYWYTKSGNDDFNGIDTIYMNFKNGSIGTLNWGDFHSGVKGWSQLASNVNIYNSDGSVYFEANTFKYSNFEEEVREVGVTFTCDSDNDILYINNKTIGTSCTQFGTINYDSLYYYVFDNYINISTRPAVYATGNYGSSYHSYGLMNIPGSTKATFQYFSSTNSFIRSGYNTNSGSSPEKWMGTDHKLLSYIYTNTNIYKYDSSNSNGDWADMNTLLFEKNASNDSLKLKNSFNSGTNAYGMSKIVWNINASSDYAATDGNINMKIQYGANDFTNKNIPIFNSYKIYGYNEFESGWTDITNDERFYFDDFVYEYYTLEGTATETVLTSTLNIPSDICVYEQIKVEFYFDNTNNFYMYVFDDLDDSSWQDLQYYFENYIYYEFPKDKKYAFISHSSNLNNVGKLYVPYNSIINSDSLFGAYIYDFNKYTVSRKLLEQKFYENDYYYYYDFEFSFENNEILMLQRKIGTDEKVSFYLPCDYIVEFSNDEDITLLTPDGYLDIETGRIDNIYRNDDNGNLISFWDIFKNSINYFTNPIGEIFEYITIFFNSLPNEIKYTFYVSFIFIILYYLTKFIL